MVTEDHKELIQKAVSTKDKAVIDAAFQRVLQEEIGRISKTSNVVQDYICELTSFLKVPYKYEVTSKNEVKNETPNKYDYKFIGISLVVFIAIAILSSELGKALGICFSIACAGGWFYYMHILNTKNSTTPTKQEYLVIETVEGDDLIKLVDGFMNKIRLIVEELTIQEVTNPKPVQLPLHECYPNVLKRFQNLDSDSLDIVEKSKAY